MFNVMFKFAVMFNVMYFSAFSIIATQRNIVIFRIVSEIFGFLRYGDMPMINDYVVFGGSKMVLDCAIREPLQIALVGGMINK